MVGRGLALGEGWKGGVVENRRLVQVNDWGCGSVGGVG